MPNYYPPLVPQSMYHIISRAVGNERLFPRDNDYQSFLKKYGKYVLPIADTFAYCLLPNHFHFLLEIKSFTAIEEYLLKKKHVQSIDPNCTSDMIMECFSNLLNSYAKSFNYRYERKGGLFIDYLKRVEIIDDSQFGSTIFYIHKNAVHHGYCHTIDSWRWSSYNALISTAETNLKRNEVLDWFGGVVQFKEFHQQPIHLKTATVLEI